MKPLLLAAFAAAAAGCNSKSKKDDDAPAQPYFQQPAVPGVAGKPVARVVTGAELKDLHLFIETASGASGTMPSVAEITQVISAPSGNRLLADASRRGI